MGTGAPGTSSQLKVSSLIANEKLSENDFKNTLLAAPAIGPVALYIPLAGGTTGLGTVSFVYSSNSIVYGAILTHVG